MSKVLKVDIVAQDSNTVSIMLQEGEDFSLAVDFDKVTNTVNSYTYCYKDTIYTYQSGLGTKIKIEGSQE